MSFPEPQMPPKPPQIQIAGTARRAAARAPVAGQRRNPADEVCRLSDMADQLLRLYSVSNGTTADRDREIDMVEEIAAGWCALKAHHRGPSSTPCRKPLWMSPDGKKAMW